MLGCVYQLITWLDWSTWTLSDCLKVVLGCSEHSASSASILQTEQGLRITSDSLRDRLCTLLLQSPSIAQVMHTKDTHIRSPTTLPLA